ncbi:beta-propeller domain-containing protein [Amycolatopsis suaedae]|uniref:Benzoate transporter n=1 Tax=Amycolatopsis suaedae TaxID=2510978 RepID=A0A4Q7JBM0_9PSEU|nr:beta-propeller domain-containing protein [Amycolatopsis suaedae]RZQ64689.1 benzoate transporter [Amycolatopsis suaedae]
MRPRLWLGLGVATTLVAGIAVVALGDRETTVPPEVTASPALAAFDSCPAALEGFRSAARNKTYWFGEQAVPDRGSGDARAAAPEAQEHSGTNNHEAGVQEGDLVKTDGRRVVTLSGSRLRVVDVASKTVTATVDLPGGSAAGELLLAGDRALILGAPGEAVMRPPNARWDRPAGTEIVLVDLTGSGRVIGTLEVDGAYVAGRQTGNLARVVVRSTPQVPARTPDTAPIEDWLPRYRLDTGGRVSEGSLVDCTRISHPDGYTASSMLTVLTFDLLGEIGRGDPVSIVADGNDVYATETSLYVAEQSASRVDRGNSFGDTGIHQFDISQPGPPKHVASGRVDGLLLNQYAMSEHAGHLRVATTLSGERGDSESAVTVLARRDNRLDTVGRVDGLGRGERIHGVRFVGPVGYVVTFRQTDPLYTVDLSDPARPRATGELKITGYSAYLHDVGNNRLIGVGQEADTSGRRLGTQVSLFDVADPAAPRRLAQHHVPDSGTEVESDPHAFLFWPKDNLVVVPLSSTSATETTGGAMVLRLGDGGFTELGVVRHDSAEVRRSLVIGSELWTVSEAGAMVSALSGLTRQAWIPLR